VLETIRASVANRTRFDLVWQDHVFAGSNGQNFTVDNGSHHLLLYLDAKSTKTSLVTLTSDNADYSFHTLDVTRIE